MSDAVTLNTKALDSLISSLKGKLPVGKIGIIGTDTRKGGGSNATIGAKHEYGLDGLPVRSFLRVPLLDNLEKYLEKSDAFNPDTLKKVQEEKSIIPWMEKVMIVAEAVVQDAFDSSGFGKWRESNMTKKKRKQTLVETAQLRNSIISEVK